MDPEETHILLRQSWSAAVADKAALARLFYRNLFRIAPETEPLFEPDLTEQGRKLVATLAFIIDSLDDTDTLLKAAGELAQRHVDYNVLAHQYAPVGQALIETLAELLGDKFDVRTKDAWLSTYTVLAQHMIATAYPQD